jgi:hypothetical protein
MDIFAKLSSLNLPPHEYIVTGSGILAALNIRPANDIDLLVSPRAFAELRDRGWKFELVSVGGIIDREKLSFDIFEAFHDFKVSGYDQKIEIGTLMPTVVNGINFLPLTMLREIKLGMKRDKDLVDIELIDSYLYQANTLVE